eukprot:CAMPEP_0179032300 /NCGR_PEP_ID=MMETSP0796-20121207/11512_1 /TAXON_ID=73915 /ORGANISM="Pyrodinium bahamense, Strain pbaha01" /LENGTH=57 /DNA_ID=CAMNT_0020728513 /DNA_START=9 /DNA_END=179 /DNA_ORIENTATION=-
MPSSESANAECTVGRICLLAKSAADAQVKMLHKELCLHMWAADARKPMCAEAGNNNL